MLIPIIKVHDTQTGRTHIVGTNSHDTLYIDDKGTIQYYNLQNGEGTKGDYQFVGEPSGEYGPGLFDIEFVSVEDLLEIAKKDDRKKAEIEAELEAALPSLFEAAFGKDAGNVER